MVTKNIIVEDDGTDSSVQYCEVESLQNIITQTLSQFKSFNIDFDPTVVLKKHSKTHVSKIAFFPEPHLIYKFFQFCFGYSSIIEVPAISSDMLKEVGTALFQYYDSKITESDVNNSFIENKFGISASNSCIKRLVSKGDDGYINDEAICVAAISMFAKIGVKVNLDAKTKSQHFSEVKEGDANGMTSDMYMLGWGVPTFDSHYVYSYLFDSAGSWNKVNFSNARVDELVAAMGVETDLEKRNAMIAEAWDITQDDVTYLPLHHQVVNQASKSNVDVPIRMNNEPLFRFANVN